MDLVRWLRFNIAYLGRPPWDTGISPPELMEFIARQPPGRAIDIGCGTGTNALTLAQHGWQVVGIDFAPRAIQSAKEKSRTSKLAAKFMVTDFIDLDLAEGPFEFALDLGCFHSVADQAAYLDKLGRLLAPGGHWLIYAFVRSDAHPSGFGLKESSLELIRTHKLNLIKRENGSDRGGRPSAWFLFQNP